MMGCVGVVVLVLPNPNPPKERGKKNWVLIKIGVFVRSLTDVDFFIS